MVVTILYEDDTCVLLNGKQYNDLVKFLNLKLEKLSNWLRSNKLSLNVGFLVGGGLWIICNRFSFVNFQ